MNFKELNDEQKPREKAIKYGIEILSDIELLAIFLRTGTKEKNVIELAKEIINCFGGFANFTKVNLNNLLKINGIGKSKALEIICSFELAKRIKINSSQAKDLKINWPEDVFNLFKTYYYNLGQEHFYLLLLNNQNKLIHQSLVYKGTNDSVKIDVRDILHLAILYQANKVVFIHNHPSGDSEPSLADLKITEELDTQIKLFNIILVDHIIIGWQNYYSIKLVKKYYFSYENHH